MSDEAGTWLRYAEENLQSARLLLEHGLLNPCLQNAQQAVEKALKAILIARAVPLRRRHSIQELANLLAATGPPSGVTAEECNLLDAIYLPSKLSTGQRPSRFCTGRRGMSPMRTDRRESCCAGKTIDAHSIKQLCYEEGAKALQHREQIALLFQCRSA